VPVPFTRMLSLKHRSSSGNSDSHASAERLSSFSFREISVLGLYLFAAASTSSRIALSQWWSWAR